MYAKIFRQIFESSIAERPELRHIFMDLLILADENGVVDMTQEAIARITNLPLENIKKALDELQKPDPRSRTSDHNGARLVKLDDHRDWGWAIVNYDRFRDLATEHQRKEKTRIRVQKFRQKIRCNADVTPCNADVTPPYAYASASASASGEESLREGNAYSNATSIPTSNATGISKPKMMSDFLERMKAELAKPEPEAPPPAPKADFNVISALKAGIDKLYKRTPGRPWANVEERLLADICKHGDPLKEWKELLAFRDTPDSFFPRSVVSLLEKWQATLDRARTVPPKPLTPLERDHQREINRLLK